MSKLAVLGGEPQIKTAFNRYNSLGREETEAVNKVMQSGNLSLFLGVWGEYFDGGPSIKEFEQAFSSRFQVKHAISVNSATSGLYAAMGAAGVSPGDEVIVPPYTMSATVMAPLIYGGIPVFADIEPDTFCIDPARVEELISSRTKAIIAVNLFGHPARLAELREIADKKGIYLIEDNAQAPLAAEGRQLCGTIGHIGVFSLNYHKHIHTGEGGVCVTQDDQLALRLRLIRNHGENGVEPSGVTELSNLIGFNYRLTEIGAAIGTQQLKKVDALVAKREKIALQLTEALSGIEGFSPPVVRPGCRHVFYVWSARYDQEAVGACRETFNKALIAEGLPALGPYVKPLYLLPVFQKKIAVGSHGYPFNLSSVSYEKGLCPVTERMYEEELASFPLCSYDLSESDVENIALAIRKVFANKDELIKSAEASARSADRAMIKSARS